MVDSVFFAVDPRTGAELQPPYAEAGPTEVEQAAAAAAAAFGTYRRTSADQRAAFLESIADGIEGLGATLTERVTAETGLPAARVAGETARTVGQLRLFATVVRDQLWRAVRIDTPLPARVPLPRPDLRQRSVPVGPVAVFGASNFPLAFSVAGGDTASALAAGCPVIVKGHPAHPGTSELVGRVIQQAVADHDLPEGTFSLLQGTTHELGVALVSDPRVKAVGFTGSRGGGLALVAAAENDRDLAAELLDDLELVAGRVIVNGWPTGVEVGRAMVHGGPFPATSAPATTSVGTRAIERFLRPVVYQDVPETLLPAELRSDSPVPTLVDGVRRP